MGYDPEGTWNWGGVLAGIGIVAAAIITVATLGVGTGIGAVVAAAAITTGAVMTIAAATDSAMVMDISISASRKKVPGYIKTGVSLVADFSDNGGIYGYGHEGGGIGYSSGMSYSVGTVENFENPKDYSEQFYDINAGYVYGIDYCSAPAENRSFVTRATSISFGSGYNLGVGYDYYSSPVILAKRGKVK